MDDNEKDFKSGEPDLTTLQSDEPGDFNIVNLEQQYCIAKPVIKDNLSFRTKNKSNTEVKFRINLTNPILFR